tara:strand:+ start:2313 stop:2996 length:684 start_codon:yes stop_codon:yes gene_type:complete
MKYKALLVDIDNTLYCYKSAHSGAIKGVINFCKNKFSLNENDIFSAYEIARRKVHTELNETAASHNRLLYFQKMCEHLGLNPLNHSFEIYNVYWDNFLEIMKPFDGVYDFLETYKNKICLITDLTAHIQYRKIDKLKLNNYCSTIVTSEESGKEKPHPYIFLLALYKLDLQPSQVCMIGDNFKKDILGASNIGIDSIWFNHEKKNESYTEPNIIEVQNFDEIRSKLI